MPRGLRRTLLWAMASPLAISLFAGLCVYAALRLALAAQHETESAHEITRAASHVLQLAIDAEASERGFALTGSLPVLGPYERAIDRWPAAIAQLRDLTQGAPQQRQRLLQIDQHFADWRLQVAEPLVAARYAVPPRHADAVTRARSALIEILRTERAARANGDLRTATIDELRLAIDAAIDSTTRAQSREAWEEVARAVATAGTGGLDLRAVASATIKASRLSDAGASEAVRAVNDATGLRLIEQIRELASDIIEAEQRRIEVGRERANARRQIASVVAAGSLVFAVVVGLWVAVAIARRISSPIRALTRTADSMHHGDLAARAQEVGDIELRALARSFNSMAERLDSGRRELVVLQDLSQLLQSATDDDEAYRIIARLVPLLLPEATGQILVLDASRAEMVSRGRFGPSAAALPDIAAPNDCWALRQGRIYQVEQVDLHLPCAHVPAPACPYVCIPLVAHGETLGVLHAEWRGAGVEASVIEVARSLLTSIATAIAVALANIALRERLRVQSIRDPLTGLHNRRFLDEMLPREIERCRRRAQPLVVAMVDLDHFKRLNDTWGHDAGDRALQQFAEILRASFRDEDLLCRTGGEEFCIVLPDCDLARAAERCATLIGRLHQICIEVNGRAIGPISASVGLAAFPTHGLDVEPLLRLADAALYRAKREGRDRVVAHATGPAPVAA